MARNVTFQVLRGLEGNLPSDLAMGEMYFATDTGNLFFGTPGYGLNYVQIGDQSTTQTEVEILWIKVRALELALLNIGIETKEFENVS